jgi:prevent-host-death family protein
MSTTVINIHQAKTQLSKLVDLAAAGREFIIAKAGKPMVRVVPLAPDVPHPLGGMRGQSALSLNLKKSFAKQIDQMFGQ